MRRFYERWWMRGLSLRAALDDAQRPMREEKIPGGEQLRYRARDWVA